ncbi:MAG: DUF3783 domain-containing protein [bacterium]
MDNGFKKVSKSAEKMFGPEKVLFAGFDVDQQNIINQAMSKSRFKHYSWVFVGNLKINSSLDELLKMDSGHGLNESSDMSSAVILSGFTENDLHQFMTFFKKFNFPPNLWAVVTPTSIHWTCRKLLEELSAEDRAMKNKKDSH